jgi:hypothetical protein
MMLSQLCMLYSFESLLIKINKIRVTATFFGVTATFFGMAWDWVHLVCRPLIGLFYQPRIIGRCGKENQSTPKILRLYCFDHPKSHMTEPGLESGLSCWKPATNRLRCGMAWNSCKYGWSLMPTVIGVWVLLISGLGRNGTPIFRVMSQFRRLRSEII